MFAGCLTTVYFNHGITQSPDSYRDHGVSLCKTVWINRRKLITLTTPGTNIKIFEI